MLKADCAHAAGDLWRLAEDSALRRNMPQRNDESEDALKKHRISFSPAGAVWGKMGQAWIPDSRNFRSCARPTQARHCPLSASSSRSTTTRPSSTVLEMVPQKPFDLHALSHVLAYNIQDVVQAQINRAHTRISGVCVCIYCSYMIYTFGVID